MAGRGPATTTLRASGLEIDCVWEKPEEWMSEPKKIRGLKPEMEQDLQRSNEDRHRIELMPKGFLQMKMQRLTTCKHVLGG